MTVRFFAPVLLSMAAFSNCSVESKHESKDLSYTLEENGCSTGKVTYDSDDDYCAKLKNDSRNNYCAESLRRIAFKDKKCPGTFD